MCVDNRRCWETREVIPGLAFEPRSGFEKRGPSTAAEGSPSFSLDLFFSVPAQGLSWSFLLILQKSSVSFLEYLLNDLDACRIMISPSEFFFFFQSPFNG